MGWGLLLPSPIMHMLMAKLGPNSKVVNSQGMVLLLCLPHGINFSSCRRKGSIVLLGLCCPPGGSDWMWWWMDGFHRFPLVEKGQVMCGGKIAVLGCWCSWHQSYRVLLYLSCESGGCLCEGFPPSLPYPPPVPFL